MKLNTIKVVKGLLSSCCVGESCFHVITGSAMGLLPWLTAALSLISSLRKSKTPDGRTQDVGSRCPGNTSQLIHKTPTMPLQWMKLKAD